MNITTGSNIREITEEQRDEKLIVDSAFGYIRGCFLGECPLGFRQCSVDNKWHRVYEGSFHIGNEYFETINPVTRNEFTLMLSNFNV